MFFFFTEPLECSNDTVKKRIIKWAIEKLTDLRLPKSEKKNG